MLMVHRAMLEDRPRCEAYRRAIHKTVRPGDVVLDLGAGTGLLGYFALQAGAARVYAIEQSNIIHDAQEVAEANGWGDRIIFLCDNSLQVVLPERVDVIVSELIGCLGLDENILRYLVDAKARFLKEHGRLVPQSLDLFLAPADDGDFYRTAIGFWSPDLYGINYELGRREALNMPHVTRTTPEKLLANGKTIRRFDFCQLTRNEDLLLNDTLEFRIERAGSLNGMIGWFHTDLAEGIGLSTSPSAPATHWKNSFLPLETPLDVNEGDTIEVKIGARQFGRNTIWTWRVNLTEGSGLRTGPLQSNFHNMRLTREMARHLSNDATPKRSEQDDVRLFILQNCDGINTMARLAEMVQARFVTLFPSPAAAMTRVVDATRRCLLSD